MGRKKTRFQWDREEAAAEAALEAAQAEMRHVDEDPDDLSRPSRSDLKREDNKYKVLVKELLALRVYKLEAIPMSDALREALIEVHRLRAKGGVRGGMRRQLRRASTLLREDDYEAIMAAMPKR